MKIVTISDTHNRHEDIIVPDGDIIIFAGDCSGRGNISSIRSFVEWYAKLPHKYKIMVAGNHDWGFEKDPVITERLCIQNNVIYLNDTSIIIDGIKIHGSPVTPKFFDWAFNRSISIADSMTEGAQRKGHGYIGNHWDKIPADTDILITHGPPQHILDITDRGDTTGCPRLLEQISHRLNLKMHVFGHIHEARGIRYFGCAGLDPVLFVNASSLDSSYSPHFDDTFVFDWDKVLKGISQGRD